VVPEDKEMLRDAFRRVSSTTKMRRFLRDVSEPTEEMLRYLTDVDQRDHVAIWAILESPDLKSEDAVGIARFVRLTDEPTVAEAAVTVADVMQGMGVGRALLDRLVDLARERGITRFRSEVLTSNAPMRAILERSGARIVHEGEESILFEADLDTDAPAENRFVTLLRAIANALGMT